MARRMLVYQAVPVDPNGAATLVGLHGRGGNAEELVSLARELGVYQLIAPQAAHSLNPVTQQTSADGFAWYFNQEIGYPEPATFGAGLWLLEQFIYDVRERPGPIYRSCSSVTNRARCWQRRSPPCFRTSSSAWRRFAAISRRYVAARRPSSASAACRFSSCAIRAIPKSPVT